VPFGNNTLAPRGMARVVWRVLEPQIRIFR
jgi:hypothetical protein